MGAILFPVLLLLVHFSQFSGERSRKQLPFQSSAWKQRAYDSDADIRWPTRLRMVDDLRRSQLLERKSRAEVIELLGEPDTQKEALNYVLGPERGFGVDYEWLQIHFDGKGRVRELKTVTD